MWLVPLATVCEGYRNVNLTIGFTNGCFDMLHKGHIYFLEECRKHCDILIIGMNNDVSVRKLKIGRPIHSWEQRSAALNHTNIADFIIEFETEQELDDLIGKVSPDVLFKGSDYQGKPLTGYKHAKTVMLIPLLPGVSTTKIINDQTS